MPGADCNSTGDSSSKQESLETFLNLFQILGNLGICHRLETQETDSQMEFTCRMITRESACEPHLGKGGGSKVVQKVRLSCHAGPGTVLADPTGSLELEWPFGTVLS